LDDSIFKLDINAQYDLSEFRIFLAKEGVNFYQMGRTSSINTITATKII